MNEATSYDIIFPLIPYNVRINIFDAIKLIVRQRNLGHHASVGWETGLKECTEMIAVSVSVRANERGRNECHNV